MRRRPKLRAFDSLDVDPAGRVGLHTLGITASFDYLFVIAPQ